MDINVVGRDLEAIFREADRVTEVCRRNQGKLLNVIRIQKECIETVLLILEEGGSRNPDREKIETYCEDVMGDLRQHLRSDLNRSSKT